MFNKNILNLNFEFELFRGHFNDFKGVIKIQGTTRCGPRKQPNTRCTYAHTEWIYKDIFVHYLEKQLPKIR